MRELGATEMGALKEGAVVVVVMVCTAVGIDVGPESHAGVAVFLFEFVWGTSRGVRPIPKPTADAPTTVAVAQSCMTRMRQSWHPIRHECEVQQCATRQAAAIL